MVQGRVRFGILGPLEMCVDNAVVPLGTRKQRAVLAILVIHRNRAVGIDELISAAWEEDHPPKGARNDLHTYVSRLRRLMADPEADAPAPLAAAPPGYRLTMSESDCDCGRFNIERRNGVQAAADGSFEQAGRHFAAALTEWRGPVLDGLRDFSFFDSFATALAEDRLVTQIARAEVEILCGRAHSVIDELETLTADHPYREPLWAQLIAAYYMADQQSKAVDAYQRLSGALADDLGIEPNPSMRAIHERILRQERLDIRRAAQAHADETILTLRGHVATVENDGVGPVLRAADGHAYPLRTMCTRIGRSPDNDIVLADAKVSRHHATIIDTGSNFVIADLGSANGVYVRGRRTHPSAVLSDGDDIGIGSRHFTFEANAHELAGD